MLLRHVMAALALILPVATATAAPPQAAPYSENPHYLAMDGVPVFPLGATHAHSWTPISRPQVDLLQDLDRLAAMVQRIGSRHVRGFVRCMPYDPLNHLHDGDVQRTLQPWKRLDDGRFDLEDFEPEWEQRLRAFLDAAAERRILVSLELWDDWSVTRGVGGAWDPGEGAAWNGHPFNPDNNVNYGRDALTHTTRACVAPFYETIGDDNAAVLRLQQLYAEHLIAIAAEYPTVIFNLSNETRAPLSWSRYWAEYLRERLPEGRMIGDMPSTNRRDGRGECDPELNPLTLAVDGRYDFVDIAQGVSRHEFGADPVRQAVGGGERIRSYRAAMQEEGRVKPLVVSKEYTRSRDGGTIVLWSRFTGGAAAARFHRPGRNQRGVSDFQYQAIEHLGRFVAGVPFWTMQPDPDVLVRQPADLDGALVLARRGKRYVVQLMGGAADGKLAVQLEPGPYQARWFDPENGTYLDADSEFTAGRDPHTLRLPSNGGHVILHISRRNGD